MKKHYNPATGKMGICTAKEGRCRFGRHFETVEEINGFYDSLHNYLKRNGYPPNTDIQKLYDEKVSLSGTSGIESAIKKLNAEFKSIIRSGERSADKMGKLAKIKSEVKDLRNKLKNFSEEVYDKEKTELATLKALVNGRESPIDRQTVRENILNNGGITFNTKNSSVLNVGFAVSPYPEHCKVIKADSLTKQDIDRYIEDNKSILQKENHYFGAWHNLKDGLVYLDVSICVDRAESARQISKEKDQKAFFDFQTFDEVTVDMNAKSGQE